jgi:hypothetical protein
VRSVNPAEAAVFLELQLLGGGSFILGCRIVSLLALGTCKGDDVSHFKYPLRILLPQKNLPFIQ